jgi:2-hydroxychromene-2-carboxylate isomerase
MPSERPSDREACLGVAEQVGLAPGELGALIDDPASETLLSRAAREAYERVAFGVPTFFFAGRMYWGNDRLVLLEHALHEFGREAIEP